MVEVEALPRSGVPPSAEVCHDLDQGFLREDKAQSMLHNFLRRRCNR